MKSLVSAVPAGRRSTQNSITDTPGRALSEHINGGPSQTNITRIDDYERAVGPSTTAAASMTMSAAALAVVWALSGGTGSYFAVYAPDHPLAITGNSSLYGALIGASISNTGGAKIHFDEALLRSSSNLKVVPGSWTETSR